MEELTNESKEKEEKNKKQKKILICNKFAENYLFNVISHILSNKNDFKEKIKTSDLELKFSTNDKISTVKHLNYRLNIKYNSFNPKRDTKEALKIYKKLSSKIEIKDEYYQNDDSFDEILLEFTPSLHKNLFLDLSSFPFCYYNNEKKMIEPYTIKLKNNKFKLFISLPKLDKTSLKRISIILENLNIIKNINDFFENVFIIINDKSKGEILQKIENEALDDIFGKNNNNYKVEIKYIFNIDSYYYMNKDSEQIINIFNYQQNLGEENEYFFILDSHNKIISIKHELELLIKKVSFVIYKLSNFINKDSSSNTDIDLMSFLKEKESIKQKNNDILKEILYFISKLKKLDYLFDLNFDISFNASVNEELTDIIIRRINLVKVEGEFRTKEYQIINKLLNSFDLQKDKINFNLKEIQTIDIEIDFTDMKCTKCSKSIPEDKFLYYCFLCKTKYCLECVHEQLKKKGKEKFIDQKHNLIFFKTRDKKQFLCLDKSKIGNNKFAESTSDDQFEEAHDVLCNGCRGNYFRMARYICINCRPGHYLSDGYIDYCQTCIEKMCVDQRAKEEMEEKANSNICCRNNEFTKSHVIKNIHKHDEHIYLMLPIQYNEVSNPYKNY